jgi:SAM-dependent methyltransferase
MVSTRYDTLDVVTDNTLLLLMRSSEQWIISLALVSIRAGMAATPTAPSEPFSASPNSTTRTSTPAVSTVAQQYDAQAAPHRAETRRARQNSATAGLRALHNYIKEELLKKAAGNKPSNNRHNNGPSLFDIGVGRGGDLHKFRRLRFKRVLGVDVSAASLEEAQRRFRRTSQSSHEDIVFRTALFDAGNPKSDLDAAVERSGVFSNDRGGARRPMFDAASSQFVLHYCFGTPASAQTFLANVALRLAPGGKFVCTFADGKAVCRHVVDAGRQSPEGVTADREEQRAATLLEIEPQFDPVDVLDRLEAWESSEPSSSGADVPEVPESLFGHAYRFSLGHHVEGIPEFAVSLAMLEGLARHHGLVLTRARRFGEWIEEYRSTRRASQNPVLSPEELTASSLYTSAEFVKADSDSFEMSDDEHYRPRDPHRRHHSRRRSRSRSSERFGRGRSRSHSPRRFGRGRSRSRSRERSIHKNSDSRARRRQRGRSRSRDRDSRPRSNGRGRRSRSRSRDFREARYPRSSDRRSHSRDRDRRDWDQRYRR